MTVHPYQPGSLKGRILRALEHGSAETYLLAYLAHCWQRQVLMGALHELSDEGYVQLDGAKWRLASRAPENAA